MQLKFAREDLTKEPKVVDVDKLLVEIEEKKPVIYYLDKTNNPKDIVAFAEKVEKTKSNIYLREVKYSLDEDDYMYEVHIL